MRTQQMHDPRKNIGVLLGNMQEDTVLRMPDASVLLHIVFPSADQTVAINKNYQVVLSGISKSDEYATINKGGIWCRVFSKLPGMPFFSKTDKEYYALLPSGANPRIAVSLGNSKLYKKGLETYRPGSKLSQYLLKIGKLLGRAGYFGNVLELSGEGVNRTLASKVTKLFDEDAKVAAVFFGSPGATNTTTMKLTTAKRTYFAKISTGSKAYKYVKDESETLMELKERPLENAKVPSLYGHHRIDTFQILIVEEAVGPDATQAAFNPIKVIDLLVELNERARLFCTLKECILSQRIEERLISGQTALINNAWKWVCEQLEEQKLPMGMAHGDFVPWNILQDGLDTVVIDWEWSSKKMPPAIDLAHYMCQSAKNFGHEIGCLWDANGFISIYLERLGLNRDLAAPLVAAYIVDWVLFEVVEGQKSIESMSFHLDILRQLLDEE